MDALVLCEPGALELQKLEIPTPQDGELVVKVETATTCGTDLKAFMRGHPQIPMPGVFGHEYSGIVISRGEGAPFEVGTDVMGVHSAPCQACYFCNSGQENLCEQIMTTKVLGSYAQYLKIPAHIARLNVFEKPRELSFNRASLLEPLACVAHGIHSLKAKLTDRVLIIGPGAIGLMFVLALRAIGVRDITLLGTNRERLDVGDEFGARPKLIDDIQTDLGRGYDVVIECTGKLEVWETSINYVRRGGTVMLFGGCPTGSVVQLQTSRVHYDQITIISPFHFGTQAVRQAREWLLDFKLPFDRLISGETELADALAVFRDLVAGRGIKYAFKP